MGFLLDTCLVSEFFRKRPDENASQWFKVQIPEALYVSVFTIGELRKGLLRLPGSRKRDAVAAWIENAKIRYDRRILHFGLNTVEIWAGMRARAEAAGGPLSMIDSLIAASASEHGLTVATRNVKDFERCGVPTFNPWIVR